MPILAKNRKIEYDFEILEKYEAGIVLNGQEVKSIREHGVNLNGTFIATRENELFWTQAKIPPYQPKNVYNDYKETRDRKLLISKKEINYLLGKTKEKGLTLMPISVYTKTSFIKMEFALVRGKKKHDKRAKIKNRDVERKINTELKTRG
jgi:SsrA-binding protein